MCTDTQYPSVVKEEPAFLCTVSVYSLVYPVYIRVRLNICKIRDQPPLSYTSVYNNYITSTLLQCRRRSWLFSVLLSLSPRYTLLMSDRNNWSVLDTYVAQQGSNRIGLFVYLCSTACMYGYMNTVNRP